MSHGSPKVSKLFGLSMSTKMFGIFTIQHKSAKFMDEARPFRPLLLQFNSRGMDRCFGSRVRIGETKRTTSLQFPVDKTPEIGYMGLETVDTGDAIDSKKRREINGLALTR